ncbi:MAG: lipopolysaccharide biosynthesis protein RfbH [Deltaproteobacteria bacterium]|nr:lipopolysaccharide biosynthesis protein RfbH [Deltaproteobacteria bacterium]
MNEADLRKQMLDLVRNLAGAAQADPFSPGKTPVHYAGRVFGAEEIVAAVEAVLEFNLTAGRFAAQMEKRLARRVGAADVALVNSGSSANLLAVTALTSPCLGQRRLEPGDEVITVAAAFPTTVAPIIQNRLVPVFVDIDIGGYNALPDRVEEAIGPRTRAILLAHTLGNPFDLDRIAGLARRRGLWLIEDNCDALGSLYRGRPTGGFGDIASFSFYPAHHITTGEGGAVASSNVEIARIVRSLRDWGRDCYCEAGSSGTCGRRFETTWGALPPGYDHKYVYSHVGYNMKMTDIQAAIGCAQLDRLDAFTAKRRLNHDFLFSRLARFADRLVLHQATAESEPSWFAFAITVRSDQGVERDDLTHFLEDRGIETRPLFAGNILCHPAYQAIPRRIVGNLENTDHAMRSTFFVGVYPGLGEAELDYMAAMFDDYFR